MMKIQWHRQLLPPTHRRSLFLKLTLCCLLLLENGACFNFNNHFEVMKSPYINNFSSAHLGHEWLKQGGSWNIDQSALHSSGDQNIPLWLNINLPKNVIVELTVWSESSAVDTKLEIFGDGLRHQSGYIVIFGGWNNKITTIARLDEHQKGRIEKRTHWQANQRYQWRIERRDGHTLKFFVDDQLIVKYKDKDPLYGYKNNKLGFSNWKSQVYYDNLKITPL